VPPVTCDGVTILLPNLIRIGEVIWRLKRARGAPGWVELVHWVQRTRMNVQNFRKRCLSRILEAGRQRAWCALCGALSTSHAGCQDTIIYCSDFIRCSSVSIRI
jgi:hypothetical protein